MHKILTDIQIKYKSIGVVVTYNKKALTTGTPVGLFHSYEVNDLKIHDLRGNDITNKIKAKQPKAWNVLNAYAERVYF